MFKKIIPILPQIIASLFLTGFIVFASWTEPDQSPPGGNVPAPLNVGTSTQDKAGWLTFEGGGTRGDTFLATLFGKVGIGTANPGEKLEVEGNIKISGSGEIKNLKTENVSSLPAAGSAGRMVFNTSDSKMYFDNGASWKAIGTSVALVGPLNFVSGYDEEGDPIGYAPVDVPADAYQVMCIIEHPGSSPDSCWQNRVYYNGVKKIDAGVSNSIYAGSSYGGGAVGAGIWDAAGGGLLEGKFYHYSYQICNYKPECGGGYYYGCVEKENRYTGSCYYTKLD